MEMVVHLRKLKRSAEYLILISGTSPPNCLQTKRLALFVGTTTLIHEIHIYIYIYIYIKSDHRTCFTEENNVHSVCRTQNTNIQPTILEVRNNTQQQVSLSPSAFKMTVGIISVGWYLHKLVSNFS